MKKYYKVLPTGTGFKVIRTSDEYCVMRTSNIDLANNITYELNTLAKNMHQDLTSTIDTLLADFKYYSFNPDQSLQPDKDNRFQNTSCSTEIHDSYNNHYYWLEYEDNVTGFMELANNIHNELKDALLLIHEIFKILSDIKEFYKRLSPDITINPSDVLDDLEEIQSLLQERYMRMLVK